MYSSASISRAEIAPEFFKKICFLLLNKLRLNAFRVSCFQADTLDFNNFFRWVHSQSFKSASNLFILAGVKAISARKGPILTPYSVR